MKRSFKNLMSVTLAVGLIGGVGIAAAGPASAATSCDNATTSTILQSYVLIKMPFDAAGTPGCYWVQARLDRYVGGATGVQINLGPQSSTASAAQSQAGVHAGSYTRYRLTSGSANTSWKVV